MDPMIKVIMAEHNRKTEEMLKWSLNPEGPPPIRLHAKKPEGEPTYLEYLKQKNKDKDEEKDE